MECGEGEKAIKLDGGKLWEGLDCHTEGLDFVFFTSSG